MDIFTSPIINASQFTHTGVGDDYGNISTYQTRLWSPLIAVKPNTKYRAIIDGTSSNDEPLLFNRIIEYDSTQTFIDRISQGITNESDVTFTTGANTWYVVLDIRTRVLSTNLNTSDINSAKLLSWKRALYSIYEQNAPIFTNQTILPIYNRASRNLFDSTIEQGRLIVSSGAETSATNRVRSTFSDLPLSAGTYTVNAESISYTVNVSLYVYDNNKNFVSSASITDWQSAPFTFTLANTSYVRFVFRVVGDRDITPNDITNVMLNSGSTALPYEPYQRTVDSYKFYGNCYQASTPTSTTPVEVEQFGDLITSGENAGLYDVPITFAGQTVHLVLSEPLRKISNYADTVDSEEVVTRKIGKYEITGQENWLSYPQATYGAYITLSDMMANGRANGLSNCFKSQVTPASSTIDGITFGADANNQVLYITFSAASATALNITDITSIKTWLATQYANGTPVTIYYVLETATTESVTVPTIPTASGNSTITIGTSLAPSKVELDMGKMFTPKVEKIRVNGAWT